MICCSGQARDQILVKGYGFCRLLKTWLKILIEIYAKT